MTEIEVWVLVDQNGDYQVGQDADQAAERYAEDIGGDDAVAKRLIKVTLSVPTPSPVEVTGEVAAEPTQCQLVTA